MFVGWELWRWRNHSSNDDKLTSKMSFVVVVVVVAMVVAVAMAKS